MNGTNFGHRNTRLIVAALVLLVLAIGLSAVFFVTAKGNRTAAGDGHPPAQPADTSAPAAGPAQRVSPAGKSAGSARVGEVKGASDAAALPPDTAAPSGEPVVQRGTRGGAPAAAEGAPAASAVAGLLGALSSAVGGSHPHAPVDFHALEALLPSSLAGMQPGTPGGNADDTMSIKTTSAHVDFSGPNDARITLSIRDATAISGLAGLADMANADASEQGESYERTEAIDGRNVHEIWDAPARHGELSLSVGQRFAVDVVGDHVDMTALKNALARIDLARLESMKDANPVTR